MSVEDDARQWFARYMESYPAPNRVNHYRQWAVKRLESLTEADAKQACKELIEAADDALQAIERGDLDRFAHKFERIISLRLGFGLPVIKAESVRLDRSERGKKSKRGPGPEKAVIIAITETIKSEDSDKVLNFWRRWGSSTEPDLDTPFGTVTLDYDAGVYRFWIAGEKEARETDETKIRKKLSEIRNRGYNR